MRTPTHISLHLTATSTKNSNKYWPLLFIQESRDSTVSFRCWQAIVCTIPAKAKILRQREFGDASQRAKRFNNPWITYSKARTKPLFTAKAAGNNGSAAKTKISFKFPSKVIPTPSHNSFRYRFVIKQLSRNDLFKKYSNHINMAQEIRLQNERIQFANFKAKGLRFPQMPLVILSNRQLGNYFPAKSIFNRKVSAEDLILQRTSTKCVQNKWIEISKVAIENLVISQSAKKMAARQDLIRTSSTQALTIFFIRKERAYTKLKYSRVPQYDTSSNASAALLAGLLGFIISEKFGFEMVDSGDLYIAGMYFLLICFTLRIFFKIANSTGDATPVYSPK
jgi:hypothetical protein